MCYVCVKKYSERNVCKWEREKERGLWGWARQGYAFHLFGVLKCKEREKEDKRAHFLPLAEFRHNHLSKAHTPHTPTTYLFFSFFLFSDTYNMLSSQVHARGSCPMSQLHAPRARYSQSMLLCYLLFKHFFHRVSI